MSNLLCWFELQHQPFMTVSNTVQMHGWCTHWQSNWNCFVVTLNLVCHAANRPDLQDFVLLFLNIFCTEQMEKNHFTVVLPVLLTRHQLFRCSSCWNGGIWQCSVWSTISQILIDSPVLKVLSFTHKTLHCVHELIGDCFHKARRLQLNLLAHGGPTFVSTSFVALLWMCFQMTLQALPVHWVVTLMLNFPRSWATKPLASESAFSLTVGSFWTSPKCHIILFWSTVDCFCWRLFGVAALDCLCFHNGVPACSVFATWTSRSSVWPAVADQKFHPGSVLVFLS